MWEKLDVRQFESFERFAFDKKGIIYTIDIAHAEHIAEFYSQQGVTVVVISSKTLIKEREEMIRKFKNALNFNLDHKTYLDNNDNMDSLNKSEQNILTSNRAEQLTPQLIQVLVSVDLFSEGFDYPDVDFIQLAKPTLSLAKYLQMEGRGLRPCKGKQCCTIIDNVELYRTFELPSTDREWGGFFLGNKELGVNQRERAVPMLRLLFLAGRKRCRHRKDCFA